MGNKCVFCDLDQIKGDILWSDEDFYAKVGFNLVSPGHIMIIPKKHFLCYADLPEDLWEKYLKIAGKVAEKISQKFSKPFSVEYGVWGQTVRHAHVHFIPMKGKGYEVRSILDEIILQSGVSFETATFESQRRAYEMDKGYVTLEQDGKFYVCHVGDLPWREERRDQYFLIIRNFFNNRVRGFQKMPVKWFDMTPQEMERDEQLRQKTKQCLADLL